ncbi:hypothetical protein VIBNISFn118_2160002 [Vibrio nigripulchritudo SFn118]|nr:hypothetical protein VIBNISFn118_2160002 [Vibrio nigripulchritudo SFn118]
MIWTVICSNMALKMKRKAVHHIEYMEFVNLMDLEKNTIENQMSLIEL